MRFSPRGGADVCGEANGGKTRAAGDESCAFAPQKGGMVPTVLHVVYCTRLTMDTMHNMHSTVGIDTPAVCILRVKHTYFKHTYELVPS